MTENVGKKWDENWEGWRCRTKRKSLWFSGEPQLSLSHVPHTGTGAVGSLWCFLSLSLSLSPSYPFFQATPTSTRGRGLPRKRMKRFTEKIVWKGERRMQLAWGHQNLKRALRWGMGEAWKGVRSVVAIVETIPNGWMRYGKRERKFLVCPRRHRPFDLIKNHLLSKLIRKATVNHLRGHSKRFLSVQFQRNPFVFLTVWLPFSRLTLKSYRFVL